MGVLRVERLALPHVPMQVQAMRGYFGVGVDGISKPMNVGNLFCSAHAFAAAFVSSIAVASAGVIVTYGRLLSLWRCRGRPVRPGGEPIPLPEHVFGEPIGRARPTEKEGRAWLPE